MDYIHPSLRAAEPIIEVPYLGTPYEDSHPSSFDDYPSSFGFNPVLVLQGHLQEIPAAQVESFVQAWLYLGLLVEILNQALGHQVQDKISDKLTSRDFIHHSTTTNRQVISTGNLQSYIDAWRNRAEHQDPAEKKGDGIYILQCLRVARAFATNISRSTSPGTGDFPLSPVIQSSLVVLGGILDFHASMIYDEQPSNWPQSLVAIDRLADICENEKAWLLSQFSSEGVYYRSMLNWTEDKKDHSKCTKDICRSNNIDPAKYMTQHTTESCNCSWIGLKPQDVVDCLRRGGIPLISVADPTETISEPNVEFSEVSENLEYVAISHVWSDGLGNPNMNALPSCQIKRLSVLVSTLLKQRKALFWMDTLCVPHKGPEKKLAISKIKETFERAARVLVLDFQLLNTSLGFAPESNESYNSMLPGTITEAFMKISLSNWMRRLWTLQEAIVSNDLDFQFADGVVNLRQLCRTVRKVRNPISHQALSNLMILLAFKYETDVEMVFVHFLNALRWRSTSNAEDEAICIAAIFDLSPERFVDLPLEDHMPQLLISLGKFP